MSILESVPDFLTGIVDDLSPGWTEQDLQDALNQANLTSSQMQELADYINVEPGGDPTEALSALVAVLMSGGEFIEALNGTNKCLNPTFSTNDWLAYSIGPVLLATIIFAFLQQRKRLCPRIWNGRPGIAYPVNLVDAYDFRVAFACAFCTCIVAIMELFNGERHINPDISQIPSMLQGTVELIVLLINAMEICFIYYPLFVCLTTSYVFLGQIVGFLYTCSWTFMYTYQLYECPLFSHNEISTASAILILPIYVCLWYLLMRFFVGILLCIYKVCKSKDLSATLYITPPKEFSNTHYYRRVEYLLTKPIHQKQTRFAKVKALCYQSIPGFKYSRRFVVTLAVSALALYEVSLIYMFGVDKIISTLAHLFAHDSPLKKGFEITNNTETFDIIHRGLYAAKDTFWITSYVSLGIMVSFLIHMIIVYRDNIVRLWKGDRSFCPPEDLSFATLLVANLRYSGYQIAYCIWGFILIQMVLWLIVFLIISLLVHPYMDGRSNYFTDFLEDYWLTFVVGYAFYYLQVLLSKLFFLQKRGERLSLNNRRLFHVTTFFLFFLNVTIGLVSCLMRIIKALIFGLLYIGRMDRCILMRGWELWDTGYRSYLGFLFLEVAHTHPVLISFCHILRENNTKSQGDERYILKSEEADTEVVSVTPNKVARNRWFVAVMLQRNPSIRKYRSPKPKDDIVDDKAQEAVENNCNPDEREKEQGVVQPENSSVSSASGNPSHRHSSSAVSVVQAAGEAFLETNPANFV